MDFSVNFGLEDIVCVAPAIILFIASIIPLTFKVLRGNVEMKHGVSVTYALAGLSAALFSSLVLYSQQTNVFYAFYRALVFDGLSVFATVMVILVTSVALIFSKEHFATRGKQFSEYVFLLMNSAIGMMILAWSNDLIVTFIGIEMMSLCLYLLVALSNEDTLSKEAAFKYFVLGSLASAVFLYGLAFIFGITGTTYIDKLLEIAPAAISSNYMFLMGILLLILGFCFKVSIAPFHAWPPDVYEGCTNASNGLYGHRGKACNFCSFPSSSCWRLSYKRYHRTNGRYPAVVSCAHYACW